jgi:hypothetical protein
MGSHTLPIFLSTLGENVKIALPRLMLACTAFAAALSACGGNDLVTDDPPLPKQPVLDSLGATRTAGPTTSFAAQRPAADGPGDASPGTTLPPASMSSEDGLRLVIENGGAKVCQPKGKILVCAVVEAPLPAGTLVQYWHLPDGTSAVTYVRAPGVTGVPDPNGAAAIRFQAAFNGAARAVLAYPGTNARAPDGQARAMACENEDCVEDSTVVDAPG